MRQTEIEGVPRLTDDRLRAVWCACANLARLVRRHGYQHRAEYYDKLTKACEEEARKRGLELVDC